MTLLFLLSSAFIFVSFCLYIISRTRLLLAGTEKAVCESCSFPLTTQDQIPIYSWIHLHGKCRYCHSSIPITYLLWELTGLGVLIVSSYFMGIAITLLLFILTIIALIDLKTGRIPTSLVVICGLIALFSVGFENLFLALVLGLLGHGILQLTNQPLIGKGDIKFIAMAGLWLTLPQLPFFLIITGVGGIITSLILKQRIFPLGPALCFALSLCVLLGKQPHFFEKAIRMFPFLA